MRRLVLLALAVVGQFIAIRAQADEKPRDLSGEWAVEWVDKRGMDYRETFFVQLRHDEKAIDGTGLDPELIPSVIKGTVEENRVEFVCGPDRHPLPFKVPPTSTFQGRITADDTMEGTWELDRREGLFSRKPKGTWTAKRTRTDGRSTVTITGKTKITLVVTSEEYDLLRYVGSELDDSEREKKTSLRRGDHYEVTEDLNSLLHHHRFEQDMLDIAGFSLKPAPDTKHRRSLADKIEAAVNNNGYPWRLDENSRTLRTTKKP